MKTLKKSLLIGATSLALIGGGIIGVIVYDWTQQTAQRIESLLRKDYESAEKIGELENEIELYGKNSFYNNSSF